MNQHHPLDDRLPGMLRSGAPLRGIFNALPSPAIVEMCGYAGFDFVVIDNEHGSANLETTENMLRAIDGAGNCAGVLALTQQDEARFGAWGARYFVTVTSSVITQALRHAATQGRPPGAAAALTY